MAIDIKLSCLWEKPQALLQGDSFTDSVTVNQSKRPDVLLKTDSATSILN